jgi:electron transport complex protein RnfA
MNLARIRLFSLIALICAFIPALAHSQDLITKQSFGEKNEIILKFSADVNKIQAADINNYSVIEEQDPDIKLELASAVPNYAGNGVTLHFKEPLNTTKTHVVTVKNLSGDTVSVVKVSKPYFGYLLSIMISALVINNFVFTKYLGLCVFFGTSKRKSTAKGMGIVFTIVMVVSAMMSWFFFNFILIPYNLHFLEIVVFIGLVSLTVQAVDTILRKVNPILFNSFGVYLVLVIANCVIIAVPLLMANNRYNLFETFMLALGAGGGFLLALYLMSSVSERMQLARIPVTFKGLPIAFIVAGQFAMAFLGFSGLQIF